MVPFSHVLAFAAVVSVLIAIPGPSVLFTISRALTVGRRGALLTLVGNELGLCVQLVAVAFGVGAVVERWAQLLTVVKFAAPPTWSSSASRRSGAAPRWPKRWPRACSRCRRCALSGTGSWSAWPTPDDRVLRGRAARVRQQRPRPPAGAGPDLILGALFPVIALVLDSAWAAIAGTAREWSSGRRGGWP